jgi:hypothetical protein
MLFDKPSGLDEPRALTRPSLDLFLASNRAARLFRRAHLWRGTIGLPGQARGKGTKGEGIADSARFR